MQRWSLAAWRGLVRVLPAAVLRALDAWARRDAQRRAQQRRAAALSKRDT